MSLILDALRKSERTRRQNLTGQLGAGESHSVGRLPVPWLSLLGLLLLVNVVLLTVFWPRADKPAATMPAAVPANYHPTVRPLAAETIGPDEIPHIPAPPPVSRLTPPGNPSLVAAVSAAAPPVIPSAAEPTLDALPADLRAALPALHLDVLGYASKPADRFVVINLKQYHVGDTLAEGAVLKDITARGAVLEFRGVSFLLPAS